MNFLAVIFILYVLRLLPRIGEAGHVSETVTDNSVSSGSKLFKKITLQTSLCCRH